MTGDDGRVDTATVLFTDVVGSTALRARIGEEAADRLRGTHDGFVRAAIEVHRGTVVKHTGDGVMATFSAAVDAVGAAVSIQQAVDVHNRRAGSERIEVRVGVSVGDVTFEGDDCFGLPVIEAQRLEAAATGGQILCADIVRHLARGRGGYEFVVHGDLELKGIPGTVPTAAVTWEPLAAPSTPTLGVVPLPPVLAAPSVFPLSGRSELLDGLIAEWKEAAEGSRRVVLLAGEPGVGKTRLSTELALVAQDHGALVLAGRCDEDLGLAFQPFVEALRFQVELGAEAAPTTWFGRLAGDLVRLAPEMALRLPGHEPPRSDPETERARLFEAVTGWIRATAAATPLLFVLDDLHWADVPTLALFRHVISETANDRVMLLGTYRDTDLDRSHPLAATLAELRRRSDVQRIAIDGLDADGVIQLLVRAGGHDLDDAGLALAEAVHRETSGNPFFVGEIVRHLVETGALVHRDGRWTSDLTLDDVGLPEGIREVVGRRITRLAETTQKMMAIAAVVGAEFDVRVVSLVAGLDEDDVLDAFDEARGAGLVVEVGMDRYRFGHALVRSTLLEELTTTRRIRMHRKIGEAIETVCAGRLDPVLTELAFHFGEAAAAGALDQAVHYAVRAGDAAAAAAAPDDAAHWYRRALEHLDPDDHDPTHAATEVDILTRLARVLWVVAADQLHDTVMRAANRARAHGLYEAMAEALLIDERRSYTRDDVAHPDKIEALDFVLAELGRDEMGEGHGGDALRARVMGALAVELVFIGDNERRAQLLDDAFALAVASDDPTTLAQVGKNWFNGARRTAMSESGTATFETVVAATNRQAAISGDIDARARALFVEAFYRLLIADGDGIRIASDSLEQLAATFEFGEARWLSYHLLQLVALLDGRLAAAEAYSVEMATSSKRSGVVEGRNYRALQRFAVLRELDRLEAVVGDLSAFVDATPGNDAARSIACYGHAAIGDLDEAAARLDAIRARGLANLPDDSSWPISIAFLAETAARVRDVAAANELLPWLASSGDRGTMTFTGGIALGPSDRLLAILEATTGDVAAADRHFAAATEVAQRIASPLWLGRCCIERAALHAGIGDANRAGDLLDAAEAALGTLEVPALRRELAQARALRPEA